MKRKSHFRFRVPKLSLFTVTVINRKTMQPVALASIALVATAATLFASADAHGQMLVPDYRQISAKFRKDSGALSQAGDQELQYAPVENLSGRSQKDFPEAATFNLMNGCRGTVYEEGNNVTTLQPGKDFDVKWIIQAPHPGTMKLSIVKPSEDSAGKITYKNYKTILTVDPFAQNGGGEDGTTTTMPTDVTGCDSAGTAPCNSTGTRTLPTRRTQPARISSWAVAPAHRQRRL